MASKIGIISGFLGAGKTTLIRKLLEESLSGEKVVLIENEFGEIGIDGTILKQTGIQVREINSGCICCTLAGDFSSSLKDVIRKYHPDRVLIEPSGVGRLSDILPVCRRTALREQGQISLCITVVDVQKYEVYRKNFAEFYLDQIEHAQTVLLSRTQKSAADQLANVVRDIREHNPKASVITTPWEQISGTEILSLAEKGRKPLINREEFEHSEEEHHHSHHADEIFEVWGKETPRIYSVEELNECLRKLPECGTVLRAKGILPVQDGIWMQFDYVPEEVQQVEIKPDFTGRLCVIGKGLNKAGLDKLFQV